ncbi:hypothetical protein D3P07_01785 [Paenibacillus sp. 1011MAR3C5]|uniref:hypothetical protein n=1 Tax=Paenibacillus sp. 1011MAR3C5 TaxID=1675787 RepID=UPI000E6B82A8|nr:hypothetical protein [Paenibacillus sp. 1011MAR3C5]RJE90846.1 hypothetical protein D3P07_01785 [Paenibacillus sp. 1011MAR3C5]
MVSEEELDAYRQSGETVRVMRDEMEINDVLGIVVAWDETSVLVRKRSRRVVKLSRSYRYIPISEERKSPPSV